MKTRIVRIGNSQGVRIRGEVYLVELDRTRGRWSA